MKREVIFASIFIIFLFSILFICAGEEEKVQSAYSCVESKINSTGCSALPFEDRAFAALATNKCMSELSKDNSSNQCWPKSGCTVKSTALAILALNERANTTKAENWLLSQTGIPDGIDWFLEIEGTGVTQCKITYSGASYTVDINADKKISKNAGTYLTLAQNNYWLKIDKTLYNKEITVSCNTSFITTLLFKKTTGTGSSTVHVSSTTQGSASNGDTNEVVKSLCFAQGGNCDYEASLWATLVLYSLHKDYHIEDFMPYLITMMDEDKYQRYLPESFLYIITDKFRTELLLKQKAKSYWETSGNRYSDTALALLPFPPDSYDLPTERSNSITWLLANQQSNGCWNNNLKDTSFLLYSIWPRGINDCAIVECKTASQNLDGVCSYTDAKCGIDNDGCCSEGCVFANDNDCPDLRCTSDSDCSDSDHTDGPYCSDDGKSVYEEVYTSTCDATGTCVENMEENVITKCSSTETCESGECVSNGDTCGLFNPCPDSENCVSGICVPATGCADLGCPDEYTCTNDECVPDETSCGLFSPCPDGQNCVSGLCVPNTCVQDGCPDGQVCVADECVDEGCTSASDCLVEDCKVATCDDTGTCLYQPTECGIDGDGCCNGGCNISVDNDCPPGPECTSNSDCSGNNYIDGPYCSGSGNKVYTDFYNYTCSSQSCAENITTKLVKTCASTDECWDGECVGNETPPAGCTDNFDCNIDEQCSTDGECVPYDCSSNSECDSGNCTDGYCVIKGALDCTDSGYFCTSSVNCENSFGNALRDYFCSGSLSVCCDTEPVLKTCEEEGGQICTADEECLDGTLVSVSDTTSDETCCLVGTCETKTTEYYCIDKNGTCKDSCGSTEDEKSYTCDTEGQTCCVAKTPTASKGHLWIFIIILLILIILAVVGIVFRDKLRVQWIKLKDQLGGKKERKKIEMPMTTHSNMNPQGRILPRRIFPPGQEQHPIQPQHSPQQPGAPLRRPTQQLPQNKPSQTPKKPEEKPKNELDDVLKKLKEMGK